MSNIQICINAVLPMFIYIAIGVVIKSLGMMNESENKRFNKILFTFFYPVLLFSNIYEQEITDVVDGRLILFAISDRTETWLYIKRKGPERLALCAAKRTEIPS